MLTLYNWILFMMNVDNVKSIRFYFISFSSSFVEGGGGGAGSLRFMRPPSVFWIFSSCWISGRIHDYSSTYGILHTWKRAAVFGERNKHCSLAWHLWKKKNYIRGNLIDKYVSCRASPIRLSLGVTPPFYKSFIPREYKVRQQFSFPVICHNQYSTSHVKTQRPGTKFRKSESFQY